MARMTNLHAPGQGKAVILPWWPCRPGGPAPKGLILEGARFHSQALHGPVPQVTSEVDFASDFLGDSPSALPVSDLRE